MSRPWGGGSSSSSGGEGSRPPSRLELRELVPQEGPAEGANNPPASSNGRALDHSGGAWGLRSSLPTLRTKPQQAAADLQLPSFAREPAPPGRSKRHPAGGRAASSAWQGQGQRRLRLGLAAAACLLLAALAWSRGSGSGPADLSGGLPGSTQQPFLWQQQQQQYGGAGAASQGRVLLPSESGAPVLVEFIAPGLFVPLR